MATCCGYQDGATKAAGATGTFLRGLAIGLSIWLVLVGTLVLV